MGKDRFIQFNGGSYKLLDDSKIPTDDPDFPSYECPTYAKYRDKLQEIEALYFGDVKNTEFLPQWSREPDGEYTKRVKRTLYHNFLKPAVNGFPGFLSELSKSPDLFQGVLDSWDNIDQRGNDLISFCWQSDLKVIRDGCCALLLDSPKPATDEQGNRIVRTKADEMQLLKTKGKAALSPYLVLLDRRNIPNWDYTTENGIYKLALITIREFVDQPKGRYGTECITRYRTFYEDGSYEVGVIIDQGKGDPGLLIVDQGRNDLGKIPIVLYSATDIDPLNAEPPLYNVAEKNRAYFELYSEYREIIHKMNTPVPVRVGLVVPGQTNFDDVPDMVFGANTGIDVPMGGDFKFSEPPGNVLESDRLELSALETAINKDSLSFIVASETEKTATEIQLSSAQTKATLSGIAILKENVLEQICALWANYYGKPSGGKITVNKELLNMPLTEGEINALSALATANHLSVISLLELLREGKRLPPGIEPAQEILRIKAQIKQRQMEAQKELQIQQQQKEMSLQTDPQNTPGNAADPNSNPKNGRARTKGKEGKETSKTSGGEV